MKRMLFLIGILCALLMGCTAEEDEMKGGAQIIGTVTDIRSGSILVEEEDSELVWVKVPEEDFISNYEVGQEVFVWTIGELMESDPPQTIALQIHVVNE
ncbi:YobA family protein [Paenisporosarcina quisquiliarum]|uniref:YobA family protein n=1 Tax=Paenisporosarcina quisquiliarum TaxID=365346 RepID=A0A9X3LG70_9BACL|nr:DUF3221 domain-containing protein [Paenisporosarcina quisquiliarum]MCZ8537132.1 YobA family protein [Paenisporosarcina quisquiliarum]